MLANGDKIDRTPSAVAGPASSLGSTTSTAGRGDGAGSERRGRPFSGRAAVGLALCGFVVSGVAAVGIVRGSSGAKGAAPVGPTTTPTAAASRAFALPSASDVLVLPITYEPGDGTGWHVHPGVHAVAILSGRLTVYDGACQAHVFGPDEAYVGGHELHLARNETGAPVHMIVTYLGADAGVQGVGVETRSAPPDCDLPRS